jgi:hypothetical protein
VLEPGDVQQASLQIDLIPAQGDQLRCPETMPVGHHDNKASRSPTRPPPRRAATIMLSTSSGVRYSRLRVA